MKEWKEINEVDDHLYSAAYVILALKSVSVNFNVFLDKDSGGLFERRRLRNLINHIELD